MAADGFDVRLHVLGQFEDLADAQRLLLPVHHGEYDRNAGVLCNVIEPAFPLCDVMACAFRGNGQDEFIGFCAGLDHLLDQPGGLFTVHGDPAAPVKEPAERAAE